MKQLSKNIFFLPFSLIITGNVNNNLNTSTAFEDRKKRRNRFYCKANKSIGLDKMIKNQKLSCCVKYSVHKFVQIIFTINLFRFHYCIFQFCSFSNTLNIILSICLRLALSDKRGGRRGNQLTIKNAYFYINFIASRHNLENTSSPENTFTFKISYK